MKKYFLFATALAALASCTSDDFVGDQQLVNQAKEQQGAIVFASTSPAVTRAELTGAAAAAALNNAFVVEGTKGATSVATNVVFDNYNVNYAENTANTTESNSSNWEYVGLDVNDLASIYHAGDKQTIKYWDYSVDQYDFIAYSLGNGGATATAITPTTATSTTGGAYTLAGTTAQLKTAHIADLVTVKSDDYGKPVQIRFRSLGSKVRMGLFENIPGYSVKDVKFYADNATTTTPGTDATLFASGATLPTGGKYTVYFPTVNKTSTDDDFSDNNKAHVAFDATGTGSTAQANLAFGALTSNYVAKQRYEDNVTGENKVYLGRESNAATYAGTEPYYQDVLPNESNTSALTLKVDYTLVSIDGTQETINVTGATAVVPAIYAKWKPGYAYTYLFKISDNTNGKTNPSKDVVGLHPITFDAVVEQATDGIQETVTTVATPSITTYQHDPAVNASANIVYKAGDIYVMVMDGGTLKDDLDTKAKLYSLNREATEAEVMDALTFISEIDGTTIKGRNGLELTEVTLDSDIETIPGEDGNDVTVTQNTVSKFAATAGTKYAYVYTVTAKTADTDKYEPITPANGTDLTDLGYYSRTGEGTTASPYVYTAVTSGSADGTTVYYVKYTENDGVYAVKVIQVAS